MRAIGEFMLQHWYCTNSQNSVSLKMVKTLKSLVSKSSVIKHKATGSYPHTVSSIHSTFSVCFKGNNPLVGFTYVIVEDCHKYLKLLNITLKCIWSGA